MRLNTSHVCNIDAFPHKTYHLLYEFYCNIPRWIDSLCSGLNFNLNAMITVQHFRTKEIVV